MIKDTCALKLVKKLSGTKMSIWEQEKRFVKKTKHHRATFFRYRKFLGLSKTFKVELKDICPCYFCNKKAQNIHHINQNKKDNRKENLIPLCKSCHMKTHVILVKKNKK